MKHRIFGKKLGRNHNERQALFRTQFRSLITNSSIQTTQAKAKALTPLAERIIAKTISQSEIDAKHLLHRYLQSKSLVKTVYDAIKLTFKDQSSNFTKITNIKYRQGDNSLIVKLSLVKNIKDLITPPAPKIETKKSAKVVKSKPKTQKSVTQKESK